MRLAVLAISSANLYQFLPAVQRTPSVEELALKRPLVLRPDN